MSCVCVCVLHDACIHLCLNVCSHVGTLYRCLHVHNICTCLMCRIIDYIIEFSEKDKLYKPVTVTAFRVAVTDNHRLIRMKSTIGPAAIEKKKYDR